MKRLALTVLFHDGPMARAYLGLMLASGWAPERCVELVYDRDPPGHGRRIAPWLPAGWRRAWAAGIHAHRMNFWSRRFWGQHRQTCLSWWGALSRHYALPVEAFEPIVATGRPWSDQVPVERLLLSGLDDPTLVAALTGAGAVLFTGGGRVPDALLATPGCRFLHVHPGHLPQIRGADGLLWSQLVRGCPGASAFYMAPGLDTGDLILARDFSPPPLPVGFAGWPQTERYRWLYAFLDPMLRALVLRDVIHHAAGQPLQHLPAQPQDLLQGCTFRFMHPLLRDLAMDALLAAAPVSAPHG